MELTPNRKFNKYYKEFITKKLNPTRKQRNESKKFENCGSLYEDITMEEIKQTIKKLKNKKASQMKWQNALTNSAKKVNPSNFGGTKAAVRRCLLEKMFDHSTDT